MPVTPTENEPHTHSDTANKSDAMAMMPWWDRSGDSGTNDATTRMATAMTMPNPLLFRNPSLLKNFVNASCAICLSSLKKERGRSPVEAAPPASFPRARPRRVISGSHPPTSRMRAPAGGGPAKGGPPFPGSSSRGRPQSADPWFVGYSARYSSTGPMLRSSSTVEASSTRVR